MRSRLMSRSLNEQNTASIVSGLAKANAAFARTYPGGGGERQPVHTVYGGAQLFRADTASKMGGVALRHFETFAPDAAALAAVLGWEDGREELDEVVYRRIVEKLRREPVEDFRIDFEDGFGNRPDDEEDREAVRTAQEVAEGIAGKTLPPFIGVRVKPFSADLHRRGIRTLDLFITTLLAESGGRLPNNFVVTLPKVSMPEQVEALVDCFEILERETGLANGALKLEIMVETPQSIVDRNGNPALPELVRAGRDRCIAAHFGVYDYTALCEITAEYQSMTHPACDFARHMMQVALAGTGVWISDGATNIMPVPPHRATDGALTKLQQAENVAVVHRAWKLGYDHIRHSLENGYYQGWDLHPAQFPIRYAAIYSFFLEGLASATHRLRSFMERAAQATLSGDVFDDAATGQAMLNYFLRALSCGAIAVEEAAETGLTLDELRTRSFYRILKARRGGGA